MYSKYTVRHMGIRHGRNRDIHQGSRFVSPTDPGPRERKGQDHGGGRPAGEMRNYLGGNDRQFDLTQCSNGLKPRQGGPQSDINRSIAL